MDAIGILGGSFDPVHVGHMQLARDALANLPIAEVHLLPAAQAWQKDALTDPAHRAAMIQRAIDGELPFTRRRMLLDLREIDRGGPTYTVDTLSELRREMGADVPVILIMGADQFARFDTWREWERIFELAHLAIARRPGTASALKPGLQKVRDRRYLKYAGDLVDTPGGHIVDLAMTPVDASATIVRALLAETPGGENERRLAALVPPAVLDYIRAHHLYSGHDGH